VQLTVALISSVLRWSPAKHAAHCVSSLLQLSGSALCCEVMVESSAAQQLTAVWRDAPEPVALDALALIVALAPRAEAVRSLLVRRDNMTALMAFAQAGRPLAFQRRVAALMATMAGTEALRTLMASAGAVQLLIDLRDVKENDDRDLRGHVMDALFHLLESEDVLTELDTRHIRPLFHIFQSVARYGGSTDLKNKASALMSRLNSLMIDKQTSQFVKETPS
jgi:hypothetical protein